jgi:cytochrome c oxidase assembly protein subunit 15
MLVLLAVLVFWYTAIRVVTVGRVRAGIHLFLAVALAQVVLGVLTLLMQVPVALGAAHQGGALVLFTIALFVTHGLCRSVLFEATRATVPQAGMEHSRN